MAFGRRETRRGRSCDGGSGGRGKRLVEMRGGGVGSGEELKVAEEAIGPFAGGARGGGGAREESSWRRRW